MRGYKLRICVLFFCFALAFVQLPAKAQGITDSEKHIAATYDFQKGGTQKFEFSDGNDEVTIVIEEITTSNVRMENNIYKISYTVEDAWTAGFYAYIQNYKFVNVYSPFYEVWTGSVSKEVLERNTDTKATYSFVYKKFLLNYNTGVLANISNSKLIVTKK